MKRFLLSLMVLVMLTPGLACAQFMDNHKAPMAKTMSDCPKSKTSPEKGMTFFKDCLKVDLQQASSAPLLKNPDIAKHSFPFVQVLALNKEFSSPGNHAARGPPFEGRLSLSGTQLPIFLMTQRLRI
jgi:hypothetical protein